jgi:hypothetical protein
MSYRDVFVRDRFVEGGCVFDNGKALCSRKNVIYDSVKLDVLKSRAVAILRERESSIRESEREIFTPIGIEFNESRLELCLGVTVFCRP